MIVGVAGYQDSGKTTFIELTVPRIVAAGFSVVTVKHIAHDDLRVDAAGSDTQRHRLAGAKLAVAVSDTETVYFHGRGHTLDDVLARVKELERPDLILVEGFKGSSLPKIVVGDVEHAGPAKWRWDGTPAGAAAIAEDLMFEIRGERSRTRKGNGGFAPPSSPGRKSAGARSRLRSKRRVSGRRGGRRG